MNLGRDHTMRLLLVLAAPLVLLVGLELGLRVLQNLHLAPRYGGYSLTPGDDATNAFNAKLQRSDDPKLGFEFAAGDPLLNAKGTRGPDFETIKPAGTFRIAALGDSVTFGLGVASEEIWTARLEALLRAGGARREVLNFGVNGYGTAEELHLYRKKVEALAPDLVLVGYVLNDPFPPEMMMKAASDRARSILRVDAIAPWSQLTAMALVERERLLPKLRPWAPYDNVYADGEAWERQAKALRDFADVPRGGPPVAFVIFPLLVDASRHDFRFHLDKVRQALTTAGLPFLDLSDVYARAPIESLKQQPIDETHPNAEGHRLAAESLAVWLPTVVPALRTTR